MTFRKEPNANSGPPHSGRINESPPIDSLPLGKLANEEYHTGQAVNQVVVL